MSERKRLATPGWILHILVLVLVVGLTGCGPTATPEPTPTQLPTATPQPTPTQLPTAAATLPPEPARPEAPTIEPAGEITVEAGTKVAARASTTGADRYEWTLQGDGEISGATGPAIIYTAPEAGGTIAVLTVIAYNDQGASPPTSLVINVATMASVRLDALASPAGWMSGGGSPESFISFKASSEGCHTGSDCLQITYRPGGGWGGIYWWPLSCGESGTPEAWDRVRKGTCGINVLEAGHLGAASRLTFWARGDKGGEVVEFKIGAVDVLPTPGRSLGRVTLKPTWEQYAIELEGMDLTNVIGLFLWVATDVDNTQGAVFYLDDIQFEGVK